VPKLTHIAKFIAAIALPALLGADASQERAQYEAKCLDGDTTACFHAGRGYMRGKESQIDYASALKYLQKACDGDGIAAGAACWNIAHIYSYDREGIARDDVKRFEYQKLACDRGWTISCSQLGGLYKHGIGHPQDASKALFYYAKACDDNNAAGGCYYLMEMYKNGDGVEKNITKANQLNIKICEFSGKLCGEAAKLYEYGIDVDKNAQKALEFYKKGCEKDDEKCNKFGIFRTTIKSFFN